MVLELKNFLPRLITGFIIFATGGFIGVLSGISFLRTVWPNFNPDFFFWVSLVTTIMSLVLLCFSLWQHATARAEKKKGDAQVKIWMEEANGLDHGLRTIAVNSLNTGDPDLLKYSSVNDVGMAIYALADSAKALYQSLYEERCVTEEEYSAQQKELGAAMHKQRLAKIKADEQNPANL